MTQHVKCNPKPLWKKGISCFLIASLLIAQQGFSLFEAAAQIIADVPSEMTLQAGAQGTTATAGSMSSLQLPPISVIIGGNLSSLSNPIPNPINSSLPQRATIADPPPIAAKPPLASNASATRSSPDATIDNQAIVAAQGPAAHEVAALDQEIKNSKETPGGAGNFFNFLFDGQRQLLDGTERADVPPTAALVLTENLRSEPSSHITLLRRNKSISVMAPLRDVTDWDLFSKQLKVLKEHDITGISTDLWWGKFEKAGDNQFDWSYYLKYAEAIRKAGLRWEPILSFHQCGGNVEDDCNEPLPKWIWGTSSDPGQTMKFIDENGFANGEYISFWHEDAYTQYSDAMASFATHFASYADVISKIDISLGPAGELRFPSYNFSAGWEYPQRGKLQAYSPAARQDFRLHIQKQYGNDLGRINEAWGTDLRSFDEIRPPDDGDRFFQNGIRTAYGHDFLDWYQSVLENHLKRMMEIGHRQLDSTFKNPLSGKIAGIHWLYESPIMPHAAEISAGYVSYDRLIAQFKDSGADLTFTALELDNENIIPPHNNGTASPPSFSEPQKLAREIAALARNREVAIYGENALPISSEVVANGQPKKDEGRYRNIRDMLSSQGFSGFTLLRLNQLVDSEGNPTPEMAPFVHYVVSDASEEHPLAENGKNGLSVFPAFPKSDTTSTITPLRAALAANDGRVILDVLTWAGLAVAAAFAVVAWPRLLAHYGTFAVVSGVMANIVFLRFPFVQIRKNTKNIFNLQKGGAKSIEAKNQLKGVDQRSQLSLLAGNLLNFPNFLTSGNPLLILNALVGAGGSWYILRQLKSAGLIRSSKWASISIGGLVLAGIGGLILTHPLIVNTMGILAIPFFAGFLVWQIISNSRFLSLLRKEGTTAKQRKDAFDSLQGIRPSYLIVAMLGNLLLVPVFMVSGHLYNVVGNLVGIFGPLYVMRQLSKVGLFPKNNLAQLTVGASIWIGLMIGVSMMVPTGFWALWRA